MTSVDYSFLMAAYTAGCAGTEMPWTLPASLEKPVSSVPNKTSTTKHSGVYCRALRRRHCVGGGAPVNFGQWPPVKKNRCGVGGKFFL